MTGQSAFIETKSANRRAFEHYLRTGQRLAATEWQRLHERKFNPNHDPEDGRFTFALGGTSGGGGGLSRSSPKIEGAAMASRPPRCSGKPAVGQ